MCGIIACIGNDNIVTYLLNGLERLQNRGYDSAGYSIFLDEFIITRKYSQSESIDIIKKLKQFETNDNKSCIGIGHTRWATHGAINSTNSHPHESYDRKFTIVHNGIIENYKSLKAELVKQGVTFISQTDSEVIVNMIAYLHTSLRCSIEQAIDKTIERLEGTYGIAIMCKDTPNTLYCIRRGSPLLIGINDTCAFVTSEQSGFNGNVNNYFELNNLDLCRIHLENGDLKLETGDTYTKREVQIQDASATPHPYQHWTLKEIYEQPDASLRAIGMGGRLTNASKVRLGGLYDNRELLREVNHIIIVGCGTSYFAGMIGMKTMRELCRFHSVQIIDGADLETHDIAQNGRTAMILCSQSGETKDLHRCVQIGKENNAILIGVINVVDSLIAREVHCGCYLNAGREVAVASTKSFTSQVVILTLISLWFAQEQQNHSMLSRDYIKNIRQLHVDIKKTIELSEIQIEKIVPLFDGHNSCFILGKGKGEAIARESALKVKEISYIHAEAYSTSSLKHGPFALLEEGFPVVLFAPNNEYISKALNAYEEMVTRKANVIVITNSHVFDVYEDCRIIRIPNNESFQDLLCVIPMQLLAYYLSLRKNMNPDKPRNLAKVVTVE